MTFMRKYLWLKYLKTLCPKQIVQVLKRLLFHENRPSLLIYVAHDVQLVPGCPYYIEKNITLTPSQKLCISLPNVAPNTNGGLNVHVVASAIIFTDDIEE